MHVIFSKFRNLLTKNRDKSWQEKFPDKSAKEKLSLNLNDCSWPNIYYELSSQLLGSISKPEVRILEVGVAYGYHAHHLLGKVPSGSAYVGIDPYLADYDGEDFFCDDVSRLFGTRDRQGAMNLLYETVEKGLRETFGERASLFRGNIDEYALKCKTNFDFVWIDGDHRYSAVKRDIAQCWEMLSEGGILAGDDYNWPDVNQAVREFSISNNLDVFLMTNVSASNYRLWWIRKRLSR